MPASWESEHFHLAPWYQVTQASWRKYPNLHSPHVIAVDTLSRHVTPEGVLVTQRLLTSKQAMPGFIRRLFGTSRDEGEVAYALEISELDPRKKTYTARSVNLNWNHLVKVDESIELHEDPEDVMKTKMNQRVEITCSLSKMSRLVEDALVGKYKANAVNGKLGFQHVLNIIMNEEAKSTAGAA